MLTTFVKFTKFFCNFILKFYVFFCVAFISFAYMYLNINYIYAQSLLSCYTDYLTQVNNDLLFDPLGQFEIFNFKTIYSDNLKITNIINYSDIREQMSLVASVDESLTKLSTKVIKGSINILDQQIRYLNSFINIDLFVNLLRLPQFSFYLMEKVYEDQYILNQKLISESDIFNEENFLVFNTKDMTPIQFGVNYDFIFDDYAIFGGDDGAEAWFPLADIHYIIRENDKIDSYENTIELENSLSQVGQLIFYMGAVLPILKGYFLEAIVNNDSNTWFTNKDNINNYAELFTIFRERNCVTPELFVNLYEVKNLSTLLLFSDDPKYYKETLEVDKYHAYHWQRFFEHPPQAIFFQNGITDLRIRIFPYTTAGKEYFASKGLCVNGVCAINGNCSTSTPTDTNKILYDYYSVFDAEDNIDVAGWRGKTLARGIIKKDSTLFNPFETKLANLRISDDYETYGARISLILSETPLNILTQVFHENSKILTYFYNIINNIFFQNQSVILSYIILIGVILFFILPFVKNIKLIPHNWQQFWESLYKFILNILEAQVGAVARKFFPYVFSIFIIILVANIAGMTLYSFTLTSHILVTFTLGVSSFFGLTILGLFLQKFEFFNLFIPKGIPKALIPILLVVEVISYVSRALSLSIRLFANLMSGHTLLHILAFFSSKLFKIKYIIGFLSFLLILAIVVLEFCIAILQAYVFAILICIYLNDAYNASH